MKNPVIPFSPFPFPILRKLGDKFLGVGYGIEKSLPSLEVDLQQAEINLSAREYGSIIFVLCTFYFVVASLIAYLFGLRIAPQIATGASIVFGTITAFLVFTQLAFYPKIFVKKKVRDIERNLVFALRTVLIEIKSGVTLFDSLNILAIGKYGQISAEIKKTIEKINTGTIEEYALDEMASKNPSLFFRRAIWQIVNGLKAGSDTSTVLSTLVQSLTNEQKNQVKLYGASLKLLSLVYMMLGVIVPALGLTLLIILSTFPQITIQEIYFWMLLVFLVIAQFMYLGLIKAKRPNLIGE